MFNVRSASVLSAHENFYKHLVILLLASVQSINSFCTEDHWWHEERGTCVPCTVCDNERSIVLRPCQLYTDAVCGTLDDLELDWLAVAAAAAEKRKYQVEEILNLHVVEELNAEMLKWNWQSLSLALVIFMCLLFFIVAACVFWRHTRYFKKLEKMETGYCAEAEEVSTHLMHTVIDIRNDDSGRIVLEVSQKEKIDNPFNLQCIYFEELLNNDSSNKSLVTKPLIKINSQKLNQRADTTTMAMPIKSKIPADVNNGEGAMRKQQDRGNCYMEPIHQNNCATSELYLIT